MENEKELNDEHYQEPKEDIFLNGHLIEFFNENFYCHKGKVSHEEMIDTIDFIGNINEGIRQQYEKPKPLFIDIFNMKVNINVLEQVFREFEPNI